MKFIHQTKIGMLQRDATIITLLGFYSTKLDIYITQTNSPLFRKKIKRRKASEGEGNI
jgi:hypothetical protein